MSISAAVIEGRNPEWREAWEQLDDSAHARVRDALKNATRIEDPDLEPFVSGLIARTRHGLRLRVANFIVLCLLAGFWCYATIVLRPSPLRFFWLLVFVLLLILGPMSLRSKYLVLARAEQAQASPTRVR